jgi:hypothetical protein
MAFLTSLWSASWPGTALQLALADQRVDAFTLTPNRRLDGFLDLRLRGGLRHVEDDLVVLGDQRRLLGDRPGS